VKWSGPLRDGKPDGAWYAGFAGGNPRSEGRFAAGRPVGSWRTFFEGGSVELEGVAAGVDEAEPVFSPNHPPTGRWVRWTEAGTLRAAGVFDADGPEGLHFEWYKDGPLHRAGVYVKGQREGWWVSWWLTGAVHDVSRFVGGRIVEVAHQEDERGRVLPVGRVGVEAAAMPTEPEMPGQAAMSTEPEMPLGPPPGPLRLEAARAHPAKAGERGGRHVREARLQRRRLPLLGACRPGRSVSTRLRLALAVRAPGEGLRRPTTGIRM
jgi:hypothetical protein